MAPEDLWIPCQSTFTQFLRPPRGHRCTKDVGEVLFIHDARKIQGYGAIEGNRSSQLSQCSEIFFSVFPGCCVTISESSNVIKMNTYFPYAWISWDSSGCGIRVRSPCFFKTRITWSRLLSWQMAQGQQAEQKCAYIISQGRDLKPLKIMGGE